MIELIRIQNDEWNTYVKKCPYYDVFYLREYVQAFMNENEENGEPILFVFETESDYGINVVFKRDIAKAEVFKGNLEENKYFDLISPYGYGGFIGCISDYEKLNAEYEEYCKVNGYISEFVRFELFSDYYKFYPGSVESRTRNVVRGLELDTASLWMDFKQKVRKNVKRAIKNGLQIEIDTEGRRLADFLGIYYGTMERTNANDGFFFSKEFFETLNKMRDNVVYFHVIHEGKVISTELVIYGPDTCYSYLGGTNDDYFDLRPNDYLKYEIIKWAQNRGLKRFVLGGGYGADDGIFQYKSCFAPSGIVDFYIGRNILDEEKYRKLAKTRKKLSEKPVNEEFFPVYRS